MQSYYLYSKSKAYLHSILQIIVLTYIQRLVKEFRIKKIAQVNKGRDKETEVLRQRTFYNKTDNCVNNKVCFIVTSLKIVYQSINLIKGYVFKCIEPYSINAKIIQFRYYSYRIRQVLDIVIVNYLLYYNLYIKTLIYIKNIIKNRFAQQCYSTRIDKIQELAASIEDKYKVQYR